jgi:REP element-mobilizing transposase RayT
MHRRKRQVIQLDLPKTAGWGGKRKGAGRPVGERPSVLHRARPPHKKRHPVHVTLRAKRGLPYFRKQAVASLVCRVLDRQTKRSYRGAFQVVHFSIQDDHLHLIVEADDDALRTGVSGFVISFARRLNRMLSRKGAVWADRYHRHDLLTPREVHRVLLYVFNNHLKHGARLFGFPPGHGVADPYSSSPRFEGWERPIVVFDDTEPWPRPRARTWLLAKGWRKHGPLDPTLVPGRRRAA